MPREWFDSHKVEELETLLLQSYEFLKSADLINTALDSWIKLKVYQDQLLVENSDEVKIDSVDVKSLSDDDLNRLKLAWSSRMWGHKVETLFLKHRQSLELVSCRILRVREKNLAQELYHRLKAEESTFGEVSYEFGHGHEKYTGGLYPLQPVMKLPNVISECIKTLQIGQISKPLRAGSFYFVIQINEYKPAKFDPDFFVKIYDLEFADWLASSQKHLLNHLESLSSPEVS
ncbi:peptidylprolyl isomerase [Synechococcus sp. YX-04-1]|uniref:peptidylprolyl isomerase n=1 Tax=Synechococcus sp. YX-04-1 TaxID=3062778 RepID=UPI0026E2F507|nr:peptidylprolyl isomerase [Synechococcus sp. YX-04-1]MDO6351171.1 peptidylprolyl isomerase [Synechococcus sp. YX-04-1]